nr:hypothetical protein [Tanacetum cinerariifolium]
IFELAAMKRLSKLPTSRRHVIASHDSSITGCYLEREALAVKIRVALPILTPVSRQCLPPSFGSFDRDTMNIPCPAYATGTIPARYCAIFKKAGCERSKCLRGGLHHPPLSLAKARHVIASHDSSITGCYLEREALAVKIRVALPILTPVSRQCLPPSFGSFDRDTMNIPCPAYVGYQNQVEVGVTVDCEPHASSF